MKRHDIKGVKIKLASPDRIRQLSSGEVKKPETINYRTLKPERDGLFCERIFGPTKSYECYCGKYKRSGMKFKGITCDKCGVEITDSRVRRERMGHIELAAPVAHIWFLRGIPSRLSLLLGIPAKELERVIYFASQRKRDKAYKIVIEGKRTDLMKRGDIIPEFEKRIHEQFDTRFQAEEAFRVLDVEDVPLNVGDVISARQLSRFKSDFGDDRFKAEPCFRIKYIEELEDFNAVSFGAHHRHQGDIISKSELVALQERKLKLEVDREMVGNDEAFIVISVAHMPFKKNDVISKGEYQLYHNKYPGRFQVQEETKDVEDPCYVIIDPSESDREQGEIVLEREYHLLKMYDKGLRAGIGAEAIKELLEDINVEELAAELREKIAETQGQKKKKIIKRLQVVESFRNSESKPEWMIMDVLPVIPPELRPMVQLDGGRFATSDLNDLYRRVINRNNRLKKLLELKAPDIIIKNEKRMLQEAIDALIDNGRRGKAVLGAGNRPLKSLTDLLRGKKGRFRQNLLGKRVDYSGRSVIVIGPNLKLNQCGLPKQMALELFKPFVMQKLVQRGIAQNIKSARRLIERGREEVWGILEEVIKDHPVMLNRAPTLHRLGIQSFEPVLVEGKAIRIHPLVCTAFNADFDGDQMAVHVPLSLEAQAESRLIMLATHNILSPASGRPIVTPTQDIIIGAYTMTMMRDGLKGEGKFFGDISDVLTALEHGVVHANAKIKMRWNGAFLETTPGRVLFNSILPERLRFINKVMNKKELGKLIDEAYDIVSNEELVDMMDSIKSLGFHIATISGISLGVGDVKIPADKERIVKQTLIGENEISSQYEMGIVTEEEYLREKERLWSEASREVGESVVRNMEQDNPLHMMVVSGARGSSSQIAQMAGIRGLMADPSGRIIDYPIVANFREGLNMLEYFISTHGARKGLADTALRTAKSGYLTRRLVDVAQDLIISDDDCGTTNGLVVEPLRRDGKDIIPISERIVGRIPVEDVIHPETGEVIAKLEEEITQSVAKKIEEAGVQKVTVRSPMTCDLRYGLCKRCYGRNLATRKGVDIGDTVGVIAAQSIGEPGTQLTMRTFHTGGVRITGEDITQGLPRIEQLFEARRPKKVALLSEVDGMILEIRNMEGKSKIVVQNTENPEDKRVYTIPSSVNTLKDEGQEIIKGEKLTEGHIDPQDLLAIKGLEAVQKYLLDEIQEVYRAQGVSINDKHVEVILRKVAPINRVRIAEEGDSIFTAGQLVYQNDLNEEIDRIVRENNRYHDYNLTVLESKKLLDIVHSDKIDDLNVEKGDRLSESLVKRLFAPGRGVQEVFVDDGKGQPLRVIAGEIAFRKEMEGLDLLESAIDEKGDTILEAGSLLGSSGISKCISAKVPYLVVRDSQTLVSLKEQFLASDVIDVATGEILCHADRVIDDEAISLIKKSGIREIRTWRFPERVVTQDLIEKNIIDNYWGQSVGRMIDAEGNEIRELGASVEARIVRSFADGGIAAMETGSGTVTYRQILEKELTACAYGKVLLIDVLDMSGKVVLGAGQEINRSALDILANATPKEIVVRPIYSPTDSHSFVSRCTYCQRMREEPGWKAVVHGITKAALNTDSFLSAASFQQTAQILSGAAVKSDYDPLQGLKENVIIGHLIPAGTGREDYRRSRIKGLIKDSSV